MTFDLPDPTIQGETVIIAAMRANDQMEVKGRLVGVPAECLANIGSPEAVVRMFRVKLCEQGDAPLGVGLSEGVIEKGQLFWAMMRGPTKVKIAMPVEVTHDS